MSMWCGWKVGGAGWEEDTSNDSSVGGKQKLEHHLALGLLFFKYILNLAQRAYTYSPLSEEAFLHQVPQVERNRYHLKKALFLLGGSSKSNSICE